MHVTISGPLTLAGCSIFSAAVNAIPHLDEVAGPGPWTLLVPTDEAFASMSSTALNDLLYSTQPLTELIYTHLVRGTIAARELTGAGWLRTARGDVLAIDAFAGVLLIDGAMVVRADVPVAIGVAHLIDRVLLR